MLCNDDHFLMRIKEWSNEESLGHVKSLVCTILLRLANSLSSYI